jgi:hypothetical protein
VPSAAAVHSQVPVTGSHCWPVAVATQVNPPGQAPNCEPGLQSRPQTCSVPSVRHWLPGPTQSESAAQERHSES